MTSVLESITGQFRENTGRHMLDSGDAYGRGYDRWNKISDEDVKARPAIVVNEDYFTIDTVAWLADRLDSADKLTEIFQRWANIFDPESPWLVSAETFAQRVNDGGEGVFTENTYNRDSLLSEVLQYVQFRYQGDYYVLLQTHNGCDVRGGYSTPVAYRLYEEYGLVSEAVEAYHTVPAQTDTLTGMETEEDFHGFDFRAGDSHWSDRDGGYISKDLPIVRTEDGYAVACSECGAIMDLGIAYY